MRRRKPTKLGIIGTAFAVLGVTGIAWGSAGQFQPDRIGIALLLLGAILVCFKRLETKNLAADEIYNLGRERGEADGYEQGVRDGLEEGRRSHPRPTVVPLHVRCEACGDTGAKRPVGSVADRG